MNSSFRDLPPALYPRIDHLVFEDGKALQSLFSERQRRLLVEPLYTSWPGPPEDGRFAAMANVGLFPETQQTSLVPDSLLSAYVEVHADPRPREHHSYLVWVYGKPPDVVIELVSDRTGGELEHKLRRYARIGITYYVVYDPDEHLRRDVLSVFRLEEGDYTPMPRAWFSKLSIGLMLWEGAYQGVTTTWLRWCDQEGRVLPTGEERAKAAELNAQQAKERAQTAEQDVQKALKRAETAEREVERERLQKALLLDRLRALGVNPDELLGKTEPPS